MKWLWTSLIALIVLVQARLWYAEGSIAQVMQLRDQIQAQQIENRKLATRNARMAAEVKNLSAGEGAIEERARMNLGLIREGETLFMVIEDP